MQTSVPEDGNLSELYRAELSLSSSAAAGEGLTGLVSTAGSLVPRPQWLVDPHDRIVASSHQVSRFALPDMSLLLGAPAERGLAARMVPAAPAHGLGRRHLVVPVTRRDELHAWWVVAETPLPFSATDWRLAERVAHHLASEYDVQHRIARASWNARSMLARQLVHGSGHEDDVVAAGDYLGINVDTTWVVAYLADPYAATTVTDDDSTSRLEQLLGVDVLATRGSEGFILLIEAPSVQRSASLIDDVKQSLQTVFHAESGHHAAVGLSSVIDRAGLRRAYRETREVARCVTRFADRGPRILAVEDLGPARLFVANGEVAAVRAFARDILGPLVDRGPVAGYLLETLLVFFDHHHSIRRTARALSVHENTVRLRLGRVQEVIGLDVIADANDQLSVQTALLVWRLTDDLPTRNRAGEHTRERAGSIA